MFELYLLLTLLFLWTSIAGITLLARRHVPDFAIARTAGLLLSVLLLFFVEHFRGLGNLGWALPPLLGLGVYLLWKQQRKGDLADFAGAELVFILAFLYGLFWRWSFPDISPSSEKLTDLYFISNYYAGSTLPPLDNWNPPQRFDYYYAFQHYAAALLGRIFRLEIGVSYNLAFALLMALPLTLAWSFSGHYLQQRWTRLLLVATLAFGGTGLSPLLHLLAPPPLELAAPVDELQSSPRANIINSVRFIGESIDRAQSDGIPMVLPAENFGYQFFLGDYHPAAGGFVLLLLALALMAGAAVSERAALGAGTAAGNAQAAPLYQALLALTVPLMLVTNTWLLPLQVLLILGWMFQHRRSGGTLHWSWLLGGGLGGSVLIYPFLQGLVSAAPALALQWVSADQHTPWTRFLMLHWPFLLLMLLALVQPRQRPLAFAMSLCWLALLLLAELVYIDDISGDQYQRTNTTMKWWGWSHSGIVVMLGALTLSSASRWIRWTSVAVLLSLNVVAVDLARYWLQAERPTQGKLSGHAWYTQDPVKRQLFEYLAAAPPGVVLESLPDRAYMNSSMHAIFNGKPVLLGWPSHLQTWHGATPRQQVLELEIGFFYLGVVAEPLPWLASHQVDYIVFGTDDHDQVFTAIDAAIGSEFTWHEFNPARIPHIGLWVRNRK